MANKTAALILAAGQGTRMRSKLPKVLHPVAGIPMVAHVVRTVLSAGCDRVVVVTDANGRRVREALTARFHDAKLEFAVQAEQLGTGDAARVGLEALGRFSGNVLILCGDCPLLTIATLKRLRRAADRAPLALLSAIVDEPFGYGRVIREGKRVTAIVEEKDASAEQREIYEINAGAYACERKLLEKSLAKLTQDNKQGEYYLTDIVPAAAGRAVAVVTDDVDEVFGINDRIQLTQAEELYRYRRHRELIESGVTLRDPDGTFIGADARVKRDAILGVGVQLWGRTVIGRGAVIEGPTVIRDSIVEPGAMVASFSHLEGACVKKGGRVGPFARLRVDTLVDVDARVGNFVEMKKTHLGKGAKANHLAYLGDSEIGPGSNIGAGTITCNYDGAQKHKTDIGADVFVGSNATLVAPLRLGRGAYVAAGSTVTREVPKDALAFGRARQKNMEGYAKKLRARIKRAKTEKG